MGNSRLWSASPESTECEVLSVDLSPAVGPAAYSYPGFCSYRCSQQGSAQAGGSCKQHLPGVGLMVEEWCCTPPDAALCALSLQPVPTCLLTYPG